MKHTGKPPKKSFRPSSGRSGVAGKGGGKRAKPAARTREDRVEGRIDTRRDPGYSEMRDTRAPRTVSKKPAKRNPGRPDQKSGPERKPRRDDRPARDSRTERPARSENYSARPARDDARMTSRPRRPERQGEGQDTRPSREARAHARPSHDARPDRETRAVRAPRVSLGPRPNLFGQHAVRESWLNPKRSIHALYLTEDTEKTFAAWPAPKVARPIPVIVTKDDLDRMLGRDSVHQGFAISAAPLEESFVQDIISIGAGKEKSVVLMLDQVTDPHNVGAILRSASAFGADGVVMQKRHAPELEGVLCKTACGAVDHLLVAYETNLSRSLEELTEAGYTIIGLDEHAETSLSAIEPPEKCVLILGAEGDGMRRLIREHCDVLVTLPTQKPINSLNVSNAAAVAMYALISG